MTLSEPLVLASLLAASDEGTIAYDTAGGVVCWNPAAEALLGWAAGDVVGRALGHILPDAPRVMALASGATGAIRVPTEGVCSDGRRLALSAKLQAIRTQTGELAGGVILVRPESEAADDPRRADRERQRLLQAAETANRAKDEFLAMLGHELRNPLAPILTALNLMKLKHDTSFERERTVIERQVSHLSRLVDDLLDVSRIARGKVELKQEILEFAEVVARAVEVVSPLFEARSHVLELDVARTGLAVCGDGERLVQVVTNLLSNAAKYTPPAGHIRVTAALEQGQVVLRVGDDGVGMSPQVQASAFDLFVQGSQAIDRADGGLGLGLTIVRSLVERHAGAVSAHSDGLNRGSEFVVRLPQAQPEQAAAPRAAVTPHAHPAAVCAQGVRVLVVDDNEDAAEMLATTLERYGCHVRVAHDGLEALRLCGTQAFDAALLDIGLPVMDGYELAGRLRELPNVHQARLVAVTGYGQESDRRRALAAGFEEHLVKPVDLRSLEQIVASLQPSAHRTAEPS